MEVTILLMSLILTIFSKQRKELTFKKDWNIKLKSNLFILIAVFIYLASLLNNYAFQQLPITTINIYQLSMMPIGYVLSMKMFSERPTTIEVISFCTGLAGFALFIYVHH